ncbi:MAG: hypothetical protein ABIT61_01820, partial [Steroidobacteraceae bacterium]
RSIYLVRVDLPWLASAAPEQASDDPYRGLREALSAQPGSIATAANAVLLQNFFNLLASLIGEPLSGRLLSAVLDTTASGDAQETET